MYIRKVFVTKLTLDSLKNLEGILAIQEFSGPPDPKSIINSDK